MKISHEAPLSIMDLVQEHTDYDYALVHLLESNKKYRDFFKNAKNNGREIYLDNSLHELGESIGGYTLRKWIDILEPSKVFIPDVWQDRDKSVINAREWANTELPENTKAVGVIQFKTHLEALTCAQTYKDLGIKSLALSYGLPYYWEKAKESIEYYSLPTTDINSLVIFERKKILSSLLEEKIISDSDDIHLLGCQLPQDFKQYESFECVKSIDTSNPVMAAIEGITYTEEGLLFKPKTNMNSCFNIDKKEIDLKLLKYNLDMFKKINNL